MGKRGPQKGTRYRKTIAKRRGIARGLKLAEITAERTILELGRLAFADRSGVWGIKDGKRYLKPFEEWTPEQAACLEGFEIIVKNAAAGDGHTDTVHKVRLATKAHALEALAKHFALLTTKVEVSGKLTLEDLVAGATGE